MLIAETFCQLPKYYKNNNMKNHNNSEFKAGDIVKFKCNGIIQYAYVTSIVPSGLNVKDLIIKCENEKLNYYISNIENVKHKGMVNFSRTIYKIIL